MSKYLVITGGSKGIGLSTAKLFKDNNWKVINISRNSCSIADINLNFDLLSKNWKEKVSEELKVLENAECISLVHNAAMLESDSVLNIKHDIFEKTMYLNVHVPVILNQIVLPYLKRKSSIIYIGSTLSRKAVKNTASYTISKHALLGLMRTTCQDFTNTGIFTVCILPGFTKTEMLMDRINNDKNIIEFIESLSCDNRLIEPEEIAEVIWFASQNPVLNGSVIDANLGQIER